MFATQRLCPGCGTIFVPTRLNQVFHSKDCRLRFHERGGEYTRGPSAEYQRKVAKFRDKCMVCKRPKPHYHFFDSLGGPVRPRNGKIMCCDDCLGNLFVYIESEMQRVATVQQLEKANAIERLRRHIPLLEAKGQFEHADWNRAKIKELEGHTIEREEEPEEAPAVEVSDLIFGDEK